MEHFKGSDKQLLTVKHKTGFRLPQREPEEQPRQHPAQVRQGALQRGREPARGLADLQRQQHQVSLNVRAVNGTSAIVQFREVPLTAPFSFIFSGSFAVYSLIQCSMESKLESLVTGN